MAGSAARPCTSLRRLGRKEAPAGVDGGVPAGACPFWMRKFGGDTLSHIFRVERLLVVAAPSRDLFIQAKNLFVCAKHANKKHR
jgi:hypothetical protein